ncbi:diguanylate cyclase domain-containing protein [Vreelandella neptunia]|uniref:diguanylate cyclase domain-containing protein n=1 Tax=Vreelandella neptunia TaxID=115551 RepID=UPI001FE6A167|nr:diguanylate cyclase [Halomonas neptunia]MDN3562718.1 diguanylate cyclase [Halomonas neptunia]
MQLSQLKGLTLAQEEALDLSKLGVVTISIGVAVWRPGDSRKSLVARADQSMYQAKKGGRNQVVAEASSIISPPT